MKDNELRFFERLTTKGLAEFEEMIRFSLDNTQSAEQHARFKKFLAEWEEAKKPEPTYDHTLIV